MICLAFTGQYQLGNFISDGRCWRGSDGVLLERIYLYINNPYWSQKIKIEPVKLGAVHAQFSWLMQSTSVFT